MAATKMAPNLSPNLSQALSPSYAADDCIGTPTPTPDSDPTPTPTPTPTPDSDSTSVGARAHIKRLCLRDFRNHAAADIDCDGRVVVITGVNGIGKTNLLESVSMLSGGLGAGRGLRGATFEALVHTPEYNEAHNQEIYNQETCIGSWQVLADIITDAIPSRLVVNYNAGQNASQSGRRLTLDGDAVRGLEILNELTPQLWLTPAMDRLFVDGASGRRKFLDRFAQSLRAASAKHWGQYERAMRERNRLLQDSTGEQTSWLDSLEDMMAAQGVAIAAARLHAFDVLAAGLLSTPQTPFPCADIALAGDLEAQLRTRPAIEVEDAFRETLRSMRGRDGAAGRALSGPHRSDLIVHLEGKNMPAAAASTGEQKGLLLGLLLAQAYAIVGETGKAPLLLLDEVAAHLDATRRQALAVLLADLGAQVWITGTDAPIFETMFGGVFGGVSGATNDLKHIELT